MIELTKEVFTENPYNEMWKYLMLFYDESFCIDAMKQHNRLLDIKKNRNNIEKQAKQIKLSIKQSKEYFDASTEVSIITKPLMVYYGYVALSKALILLKNDGEYSYDFMRMKDSHNHHGLNIKKDFSTCNTKVLSEFLSTVTASVNFNKEIPWGNFPVFYNSLSSDSVLIKGKYQMENSNISAIEYQLLNSTDKRDILNKSEIFNLLSLFQYMPDLYSYFKIKKIDTNMLPVNISKSTFMKTQIRVAGDVVSADKIINYSFVINELVSNDIDDLINYYKKQGYQFNKISDTAISCNLSETVHYNEEEQ